MGSAQGHSRPYSYFESSRMTQTAESKAILGYVIAAFFLILVHDAVAEEKISVVHNGVEADLFAPRTAQALRKELNAENKFVVCYIGTIGNAHGLNTLIEAAAKLQQTAPQVLFLLIGEGADKERIISLINERKLTNIRILAHQPREKIPEFINVSDACLVLLKKAEVFKTVIPTKMLEFMSCAKPVILGVQGQACEILEQANAGIAIMPENSEELAQAIMQLANNHSLCQEFGQNGRNHIVRYFDRMNSANIYAALLEELLGEDVSLAVTAPQST